MCLCPRQLASAKSRSRLKTNPSHRFVVVVMLLLLLHPKALARSPSRPPPSQSSWPSIVLEFNFRCQLCNKWLASWLAGRPETAELVAMGNLHKSGRAPLQTLECKSVLSKNVPYRCLLVSARDRARSTSRRANECVARE